MLHPSLVGRHTRERGLHHTDAAWRARVKRQVHLPTADTRLRDAQVVPVQIDLAQLLAVDPCARPGACRIVTIGQEQQRFPRGLEALHILARQLTQTRTRLARVTCDASGSASVVPADRTESDGCRCPWRAYPESRSGAAPNRRADSGCAASHPSGSTCRARR